MDLQEEKLFNTWQAIDELYESYAKEKGLSYMSLCIAEILLEQKEGCTQKFISEKTHYPKQNVNIFVKALYENGYVRLMETPSDRRNKIIVLTREGRKYLEKIILPLWEIEEKATHAIPQKDQETFQKCLAIYESSFREELQNIKKR